jgi:hypothetical protein
VLCCVVAKRTRYRSVRGANRSKFNSFADTIFRRLQAVCILPHCVRRLIEDI